MIDTQSESPISVHKLLNYPYPSLYHQKFISDMSQLQRAFARVKLATFPSEFPMPESDLQEQDEEEDVSRELPEPILDDDSSSASSASSTGTIVPSLSKRRFARSKGFVESDWRVIISIITHQLTFCVHAASSTMFPCC